MADQKDDGLREREKSEMVLAKRDDESTTVENVRGGSQVRNKISVKECSRQAEKDFFTFSRSTFVLVQKEW